MHLDLVPRQSCNACPTFTCRASPSTNTSGSSDSAISPGALAGAIVAVIFALLGALLVFYLYRRRQRARSAREPTVENKRDVPAPAETVLNRPDPTEKPSSHPEAGRPASPVASVIDVSPHSPHATAAARDSPTSDRQPAGNPFDDTQSIQTISTHTNGTNVIPIALASSASASGTHPRSESGVLPPTSPVRPARPSDLSLDGSQSSSDSLREPSPRYAHSQRSGSSYMSGASYSSEFLNEAPMIVTQGQGAVRQVLGKVKAEVIQASSASTPTSPLSTDSLKPPSVPSRPPIRSPLAASSFGPADVVDEADEEQEPGRADPFGDQSLAGTRIQSLASEKSQVDGEFSPEAPNLPWAKRERRDSSSTQAGSIVDISSATRVNVGLAGRLDQRSPYRTTMGKLITPGSTVPTGDSASLEQQQRMALAHAQAQARAHGLEKAKRTSGTSVVSTASTRADSILESFPFVPPSPIASRPVRSPPRSPLCQQATNPIVQSTPTPAATTSDSTFPAAQQFDTLSESEMPPLTPPPSRRTLGMSTASQLSTASSGLGNFPFQIDHGGTEGSMPSSTLQGRQRASLDTLALMNDLSSYPLGYDRDEHGSLPPLPKP
ncbi:hypothetical protein ID866_2483 [Astraeus odoratus]|nr:hypothetical protein ID866_2483 [Astraeus odoratus]